jgi:hypothetical protein
LIVQDELDTQLSLRSISSLQNVILFSVTDNLLLQLEWLLVTNYKATFFTGDYKIGICCFSAKHAALRRKSKDWLAQNQNNVSEWSDMSTRGTLFQ